MSNRRTRFREYMARLNAAASPQQALENGYYVAPPAGLSIAHELSARLELQPASTHLIVGGVGSGKTTEMLSACRKLADDPEIAAIYVDVSDTNDLKGFSQVSFLFALIDGLGIHLLTHHLGDARAEPGRQSYKDWDPDGSVEGDVSTYHALLTAYARLGRTPIVFMDSLDRLSDPIELESVLKHHADRLRKSRMGLVVAGSVRLRHGLDRSLRDLFDQLYNNPYIDAQGSEGLTFLVTVLHARVPAELVPEAVAVRLAQLSGGVLRDLLTLAQAAVNETYIRGGEHVTAGHVEIAADSFGRKQLLGLDSDEIATLQRVRSQGTFVATTKTDIALLLSRHVLEHQDVNGKTIYSVHPTIDPLLGQIAGAA